MTYYYKNKLPVVDEVVIAKINVINDYGIELSLNEYSNIDGYMSYGELSRKKKVNVRSLLTVGKNILLIVIGIDVVKGYIDLSKRSINDEEIRIFNEKNKQHVQLYNFFKLLFMKLHNLTQSNLIDQELLYDWLSETLWYIQPLMSNEEIINLIFNKENNLSLIDQMNLTQTNFTTDNIKLLIDDYITNKLNKIKPTLNKSIKLLSHDINGLNDIKYILDYESYNTYAHMSLDFDIEINYKNNAIYVIIIKQKEFEILNKLNDLNYILNLLLEEIQIRTKNKNIIFDGII